jgi:hypothetical protein
MLDVRPSAYIAPIAEQEIGPLTPIVTVQNLADEDARICALFRIYRESLGILEYSSVSATVELDHGQTTSLAALTPFDPGAPADDDYFILCELTVQSIPTGQLQTIPLGQYRFDIKPAPMGPVPATHHTTHENGGMDQIDLTDLVPLDDYQLLSEKGIALGYPELDAAAMVPTTQLGTGAPNGTKYLRDDRAWVTIPAPISELPQTLTDQAAIDWDLSAGGAAQVTLAGDRTLNAPTNMANGARYRLKVIQDGTGTRLITWDAAYRFPGGVDPCLTAAINCIDILTFDCDGTNMDCTGMVNALA